jgi:hypothetical protein
LDLKQLAWKKGKLLAELVIHYARIGLLLRVGFTVVVSIYYFTWADGILNVLCKFVVHLVLR